ncbi:hypothetical protein WR25_19642 isoform B [Diploscapter pachys]|uniref:BACK domain-containing protein n=1 Tax=Diploscapter pachys TaxID=2018661 RepID=A0A2A2LUE3_9BILA|nr:hypothetical protein WR25_19642 isoform A [Diploscapter pachys]PAV89598.1 hypothetical protein WR25_19642 isoform B [Diploscapter pachys]
MNEKNCLPVLILADKYNIISLKKLCLNYAITHILPETSLKDIFNIWFSYATKAYHQMLIRACVQKFAEYFQEILSNDWEKSWLSLDRDQMIEILKCNQLVVTSEYLLFEKVVAWLNAPSHPERRGPAAAPLLAQILPLIRFAYMTADDLSKVENSQLAESQAKLFHPLILLSYKFQALSLKSRVESKEFITQQFLLRNYCDIRWDKRFAIDSSIVVANVETAFQFITRSCAFPASDWSWTLKVQPWRSNDPASSSQLRFSLAADNIDQNRSIEYMLSFVDEKKVIRSIWGRHTFSKSRYSIEIEMDNKIELSCLQDEDSPYISFNNLNLQLHIKLID